MNCMNPKIYSTEDDEEAYRQKIAQDREKLQTKNAKQSPQNMQNWPEQLVYLVKLSH